MSYARRKNADESQMTDEGTVRRFQYAVGKLDSVMTADFNKCYLVTFSQKKAKKFISNLPILSFNGASYASAVMGAYSIELDRKEFRKRPELERVLYPDDDCFKKGNLTSPKILKDTDKTFRDGFVSFTRDQRNPWLVAIVYNPKVSTGQSIEELIKYKFGEEALRRIEVRPYRTDNIEIPN